MDNDNSRTQRQTNSAFPNPSNTDDKQPAQAVYICPSNSKNLRECSPVGSLISGGFAHIPSLKMIRTSHDEAQLLARLYLNESIMRDLKLGEFRDISHLTPKEGIEFVSQAFAPKAGRSSKRTISAANISQVEDALQLPKFSALAATLYKKQISLRSDKVDYALVNAELKTCNKELYHKLMSYIYDTIPRANNSTNLRINKALVEALRADFRTYETNKMTNEVFINSVLLYLLSCLYYPAASKVYETIHRQSEGC